jgi:hypothetical protein
MKRYAVCGRTETFVKAILNAQSEKMKMKSNDEGTE